MAVGEINCASGTTCGGWDNLAQLLTAGVAGARAGNPAGHQLLVTMHYDQGGNNPAGDSTGDFVWQTSQLSPGYPASPGGQLSFVTDELSILAQVPDGLGAGLFYWAPDWIPGVPWEPGTGIGSPNVNLTLFDFGGAALPSIGIFQNPAGVCERNAAGSVPCTIGG